MTHWASTFSRIRPFAGAHWSLLLVLLVAWEILILAQPCNYGPFYAEFVVATTTVCIAFWSSHVTLAPVQTSNDWVKILGRALYNLAGLVLLVVLAGLPFLIAMPTYSCEGPRFNAAVVLLAASAYRAEVETRALANGKLEGSGKAMSIRREGRVAGGIITNDGTIVVASDDPEFVVFLTPSFNDNKVQWICTAHPAKLAPASCREK